MQRREVDIEGADHQIAVWEDWTTKTLVLEGGLGSGKTFTALMKMVLMATRFPGVPGLVVEPTNDLVGTIFLTKVYRFLMLWGIKHQFRSKWKGIPNVLLIRPGTPLETPVFLRSGDVPERIVGFDVGWFILDEADQMTQEVWRRAVGRLRDRRIEAIGGVRQRICVYTPEPGYNWTWSVFWEKRKETMRVIEGVDTRENTWNPADYFGELAESHDGNELARVTQGKRSAMEGLVFRRFSEAKNVAAAPPRLQGGPEMWCDFNVAKMHWSCWDVSARSAHCIGELVIEDTDTIEQAERARRWWAARFTALRRREVTPDEAAAQVTCIIDASGESAQSSSTRSDAEVLRQAGFVVVNKATNPPIADSVLATNAALADGWLLFDKAAAPSTTRSVQSHAYGPDGKPQKGTGTREKVKAGLDHGTDGVRYGVWFHRPVHMRRGNQDRRHAA